MDLSRVEGKAMAVNLTQTPAVWSGLYEQAWREGWERLQMLPGVVLGFHTTIDGLKPVADAELYPEWADDPQIAQEVARLLSPRGAPGPAAGTGAQADDAPVSALREIHTPAELIAALLDCMRRGKARQLMIRDEATFRWALAHIGHAQLRMGGTSGNMANALAPLSLRRLTVYAHPLSRQLASLFRDQPNLTVIARGEDGQPALLRPQQAAEHQPDLGIQALHWVLEFARGESFRFPQLGAGVGTAITPRANRFIAAWNPENNRLRVDPTFQAELLARGAEYSHFIVSGFHLLSETYPDGSTYRAALQPVAAFLQALRQRYPALRVHYEFASIASPQIRLGVVEQILPHVDSLGLNEVELLALLRDLGLSSLAAELAAADAEAAAAITAGQPGTVPWRQLLVALDTLGRRAGLRRVHLHNLGYYVCLTDPTLAPAATTRRGLLFAALLGAVRAQVGDDYQLEQLRQGLMVPLADIRLAIPADVGSDPASVPSLGSGIFRYRGWEGAVVPTRVVSPPRFTVGLGDLISATAFLAGT